MLKISKSAHQVYKKRYLLKDEQGNLIETPSGLLRRVAKTISSVDSKDMEGDFYRIMSELLFLPNTPTLMNAGREGGQLSACFVLPVEDSMEGIFDALKYMALVQKSGGGTGFSFSRLRPGGDLVRSTMGVASGPVSFLKIFDAATEAVRQGGARMGANMGSLHCTHPDIMEFINCKNSEGEISNFNLSVLATDKFMRKVVDKDGASYELINPRDGTSPGSILAKDIFDAVAKSAWGQGDPGLLFIDRMNEDNPTPHLGEYETSNPCGEQVLLPFEACCLGSINLGKFVKNGDIDYELLGNVVSIAVRFLDNVVDATSYPLKQIAEMHQGNRKIGLGVMGWHDMLVHLGVPYDSEKALRVAGDVMGFINRKAKKASVFLAKERGVYPNFKNSVHDTGKPEDRVRNATCTTIAPTGSISILANASSGIEPYFSLALTRKGALDGTDLFEVNPLFLNIAKSEGFYTETLANELAAGSMPDGVPEGVRRLFKTATEIAPVWHVRHQAVFQKHTDNAVSKTVNMPNDATVEDVREVFIEAWRLGCKGITVYRDGSRQRQFLSKGQLRPTERPRLLDGRTASIRTALGNLFVTVNNVNGKPFELFAQIGKAGSDVVAFTEAIARLVSLALRCDVGVDEIIGQLQGIGGARSIGFGASRVLSVPDAIGHILREISESRVSAYEPELCPDCGSASLVMSEGCVKCEACGYSQC